VVLRRAPAEAIAPQPTSKAGERPASRRGTILVIDDDETVGLAIRRMLEPSHDVVSTTRGADALALIAAGDRYDVILCDLMMPGTNGIDVYERLLATHPQMAERIVFITGGAFTQRAREFILRVPNPRLEKPFGPECLLDLVNERLDLPSAVKPDSLRT
jgi:CheY-like chemotaxis protein